MRVIVALLALVSAGMFFGPIRPFAPAAAQTVTADSFFKSLQRPDSPNHWLVAPADFILKPDAVAPVLDVPDSVLRETFKAVVLRSNGVAMAEDSANGMHLVATTRWMGYQDDVWALFIPLDRHRSTIALYSASRTGYWDLGTNRRRLEDWIEQIQAALAKRKK